MRRIRLGVIGLGRFSERHLSAWKGIPEVEVAAVCSRSAERANEIGAQWGVEGRYTDWNIMLSRESLDAADVVTADHEHSGPALAALAAGVHVLVEKPMATTLEDADRMIAAAGESGKILMVGHVLRFDPRYLIAKERISAGEVGTIGSVFSYRTLGQHMYDFYTYGCPLLGAMIHDVDLLLWYTGQEVQRMSVSGCRALGRPLADTLWAMLQFDGGAVGVVHCCWLNPRGAPSHMDAGLEIRGAGATIQVRDPDRGVSVWGAAASENPFSVTWGRAYGRLLGPLKEQLAYFAARVRDPGLPEVQSPAEARRALQVSLEILNRLEDQGVPTGLRGNQSG